jgi:plastocyanin
VLYRTGLSSIVVVALLIWGPAIAPRAESRAAGASPGVEGRPASNAVINITNPATVPTAIQIDATVEDPTCNAASWILEASSNSSSGPWTEVYPFYTNVTPVDFLDVDLTPGATYWWEVVRQDECVGNQTSNFLSVTQPEVSNLTFALRNSTTAAFNWSNDARYGGFFSFGSYELEYTTGTAWYSADVSTAESARTFVDRELSPQTSYSFRLLTTDNCVSCAINPTSTSNTARFTTAQAYPTVAVPSRATADVGQVVSFNCSASGGVPPYTFNWNFGDGTQGIGQNVTHQFQSPGRWTVVCSVTDYDGVNSSSSTTENISTYPTAKPSVNHPQVAPGTEVTFAAGASGGSGAYLSYAWTIGNKTSDLGPIVNRTFTSVGTVVASVRVGDSNGGNASGSVSVLVSAILITASVSPTSTQPGQPLTFAAFAIGGAGAPYTLTWNFGDGGTAIGPAVTHAYTKPGSYVPTVSVSDSLGGNNSTSLPAIPVNPGPPSNFIGSSFFGVPVYVVFGALGLVIFLIVVAVWRGKGSTQIRGRSPASEGRVDENNPETVSP